jgi:hypothetical protein
MHLRKSRDMRLGRRQVLAGLVAAPALLSARSALAATDGAAVVDNWYRLTLELVRHTPIYSPPVASRAFAYMGVILQECLAGGPEGLVSLAGQVNGLASLPPADGPVDPALTLHSALSTAVQSLFSHTGPTGQRAMAAMERNLTDKLATAPHASASIARGKAVAAHVLAWAETDGGAKIENMGFPQQAVKDAKPWEWVPTSKIAQQQAPLLPHWGDVRPFTMAGAADCGLPPPPAYSEEPGSAFYAEAKEVYDTTRALTPDQKAIARFWSDDPMLSPTPPGHWISILRQISDRDTLPLDRQVEALALLGMAMADAFICCWKTKFDYNLIRPVTYIDRVIDKTWQPLLNTPPFPEYPSGHSTQSGAAAGVMAHLFGDNFAFSDATHEDDGLPARNFPNFAAAAEEAAMSRLYGGIHFRSAIEQGLAQGACVAGHVARLKTRAA